MKKYGWVVALIALALVGACKTVPKPVPSPGPLPSPSPLPTPSPAVTSPAALDAKAAEATALRARIIGFGYDNTLRDEWLAANEAYARAEAAAAAGDRDAAAAAYDEAISLYTALLRKGLAADVDSSRSAALKMREAAGNLGAAESDPVIWTAAQASFGSGEAAMAAYKASPTASGEDPAALEGPRETYRAAARAWEIAWNRAKASAVKADIDDWGFASADAGNYELAGQRYEASGTLFASNPSDSLDAAQESLLRYNLVRKAAWDLTLGERRSQADEARRLAEEAKAARAVPADYQEAVKVYEEALDLQSKELFEEAAARWIDANGLFEAVSALTEEKRLAAERSLQSMDARIQASEQTVQDADKTMVPATEGAAE